MKTVGKLYLSVSSSAVRAVLFCEKALNINIEHIPIDLRNGEHLKPEFIKINPQHTVPTYVDNDGTIVWDSHAILPYLVRKYSNKNSEFLYPTNLAQRAKVDQRLHFETGTVYPILRSIVLPMVQKKAKSATPESLKEAQIVYDFLELFLTETKWVAGEEVTIADFSLITSIMPLEYFAPIDAEKHSRIKAWIENCKELPHFDEANAGFETFRQFIDDIIASAEVPT